MWKDAGVWRVHGVGTTGKLQTMESSIHPSSPGSGEPPYCSPVPLCSHSSVLCPHTLLCSWSSLAFGPASVFLPRPPSPCPPYLLRTDHFNSPFIRKLFPLPPGQGRAPVLRPHGNMASTGVSYNCLCNFLPFPLVFMSSLEPGTLRSVSMGD